MNGNQSEERSPTFASIRMLMITELSRHKKKKNTLLAPYHLLEDRMRFSSWKDEYLPLLTLATLAIGRVAFENAMPCNSAAPARRL